MIANIFTSRKALLPGLLVCIITFSFCLLLTSMFYFKEVHLEVFSPRAFNFFEFFLYNYILKLLGYIILIFLLSSVYYLGAYIFNINELQFIHIFKAAFLAEVARLFSDVICIFYFKLNPLEFNVFNVRQFPDKFSMNGILNISDDHLLYHFFNGLGLFDLIYLCILAKLLHLFVSDNYAQTLGWIGLTYVSAIIIYSLIRALIIL